MYWIYLSLFILAILTPKLVGMDTWFLGEDDIEALLIFFFGASGFFIYIAKEKALLRMFKEKVLLQKQTNIISRDLSDSYSYIGEMNRKMDIVKDLIYNLPKESLSHEGKGGYDAYHPLIEAARTLGKTEDVSLRFGDTKQKKLVEIVETEDFDHCTYEYLMGAKKSFWVEDTCIVARSPKVACDTHAFLILGRESNHTEDMEILQVLASQALLLYCMENRSHTTSHPKKS